MQEPVSVEVFSNVKNRKIEEKVTVQIEVSESKSLKCISDNIPLGYNHLDVKKNKVIHGQRACFRDLRIHVALGNRFRIAGALGKR